MTRSLNILAVMALAAVVSSADAAEPAVYRPDSETVSTEAVRFRGAVRQLDRSITRAQRDFRRSTNSFQRDFQRDVRRYNPPRYRGPIRSSRGFYSPRGGVQIGNFGIYWQPTLRLLAEMMVEQSSPAPNEPISASDGFSRNR
eukprot:TRINITY_DN15709_c0_g1_i1.p1 TRINITY_DN15709_c0_g1~~TRINITY_DN15709_c0_g1_i1.p1  ORF type:complete len:153 (-),score=6.92 TRINITY_DN15709_c0_g1_i1:183-611(-)